MQCRTVPRRAMACHTLRSWTFTSCHASTSCHAAFYAQDLVFQFGVVLGRAVAHGSDLRAGKIFTSYFVHVMCCRGLIDCVNVKVSTDVVLYITHTTGQATLSTNCFPAGVSDCEHVRRRMPPPHAATAHHPEGGRRGPARRCFRQPP